jgi:GR25 family glycosyltransferase involved in LPS biosynthesis
MKTFVITLPSGKDRQEKIQDYFKICNINFNFYNGVSPNDIIF